MTEPLTLRSLSAVDDIRVSITIRNVELDSIEAPACQFHEPVILENVRVAGKVNFWAGYFFGGLQATRCHFGGVVDFQCGGHNRNSANVTLSDCEFVDFVNFYDCWYEGPFVARNCTFSRGSNLFGNIGTACEVQFDVSPVIERNTGRLDLNEG